MGLGIRKNKKSLEWYFWRKSLLNKPHGSSALHNFALYTLFFFYFIWGIRVSCRKALGEWGFSYNLEIKYYLSINHPTVFQYSGQFISDFYFMHLNMHDYSNLTSNHNHHVEMSNLLYDRLHRIIGRKSYRCMNDNKKNKHEIDRMAPFLFECSILRTSFDQ